MAPGMYNEIKYEAERRSRHHRPPSPCIGYEEMKRRKIVDKASGQTYRYTSEACISSSIGLIILKNCGCVSAHHIRPQASFFC